MSSETPAPEDALEADRAGSTMLAASLYEDLLETGDADLDVQLNLAVLYWQATDPGLARAENLPGEFFARAGVRFPVLLAEAERRFPERSEPQFWRRYIAWADVGMPFGTAECRELLRRDSTSLVPAMHIFALTRGGEAAPEALELLERSRREQTARSRYVSSVLEGVMQRSDPR